MNTKIQSPRTAAYSGPNVYVCLPGWLAAGKHQSVARSLIKNEGTVRQDAGGNLFLETTSKAKELVVKATAMAENAAGKADKQTEKNQ